MKKLFKRVLPVAICLVLAVALAACGSPNTGATAGADVPFNPRPEADLPYDAYTPEENTPEEYAPDGENVVFTARNENVVIEVIARSTPYSTGDFIYLYMQVGNIGDVPLAYIHGSGSNTVPDALQINLGGLMGTYHPGMMTMDFQTHILEPNGILEFEIGFAPYTANVPFPSPMPPGAGLDFFADNEEFTPASPGVFESTVSFSYAIMHDDGGEESGPLFFIEEGDLITLSVDFSIELA